MISKPLIFYPSPSVPYPSSSSLRRRRTVVEPECDKSSATTYFWYRQTLNTTSTIAESGGLNVKMTLSLLVAWIIVCLAVIKGIASSGKVEQSEDKTKRKFRTALLSRLIPVLCVSSFPLAR